MKRFLVCSLIALTPACAFMKRLEPQLLACEGDIGAKVASLAPQVQAALQQEAGWAGALDALLAAEGPAAACAVEAVIADLENKQSNAAPAISAAKVPEVVQLVRAQSWQQARMHRAQGSKRPWSSTSVRL